MAINTITISGRIATDLEIRQAKESKVLRFTVAQDKYNGKSKDKTARFIPCVAWNKLAETIEKYTEKGKQITVSGTLEVDQYKDDKGNSKTSAYINISDVDIHEFKGKSKDIREELRSDQAGEIPF